MDDTAKSSLEKTSEEVDLNSDVEDQGDGSNPVDLTKKTKFSHQNTTEGSSSEMKLLTSAILNLTKHLTQKEEIPSMKGKGKGPAKRQSTEADNFPAKKPHHDGSRSTSEGKSSPETTGNDSDINELQNELLKSNPELSDNENESEDSLDDSSLSCKKSMSRTTLSGQSFKINSLPSWSIKCSGIVCRIKP